MPHAGHWLELKGINLGEREPMQVRRVDERAEAPGAREQLAQAQLAEVRERDGLREHGRVPRVVYEELVERQVDEAWNACEDVRELVGCDVIACPAVQVERRD